MRGNKDKIHGPPDEYVARVERSLVAATTEKLSDEVKAEIRAIVADEVGKALTGIGERPVGRLWSFACAYRYCGKLVTIVAKRGRHNRFCPRPERRGESLCGRRERWERMKDANRTARRVGAHMADSLVTTDTEAATGMKRAQIAIN
tara:strand:- start:8 stop:448 length:441 start_codon:yes stop_codon:yes gene_type:complete